MENSEGEKKPLPKPDSITINISTPLEKVKKRSEPPAVRDKKFLTPFFILTGVFLFLAELLTETFLSVCWGEFCFFAGIYLWALAKNRDPQL